MIRLVSAFVSVLLLSACATALEQPAQDLKIEIVGTGEALCDVTQTGRRYRAYAPGTIRIMKSRDPLTVRCFAPGNRELTTIVQSKVTNTAFANLATGILPGMAWDFETGAMFPYPDTVVMDFSNMPPQAYPVPDYQKIIEQNPAIAGMEEFRPGKSALIRDIGQEAPSLQKRPEDEPMPESAAVPMGSTSTGLFSAAPEEDK